MWSVSQFDVCQKDDTEEKNFAVKNSVLSGNVRQERLFTRRNPGLGNMNLQGQRGFVQCLSSVSEILLTRTNEPPPTVGRLQQVKGRGQNNRQS